MLFLTLMEAGRKKREGGSHELRRDLRDVGPSCWGETETLSCPTLSSCGAL